MYVTPEKVAAANKATVEVLSSVSSVSLSAVERLVALNLNTARESLSEAASNVEALFAVKDPKALMAFVSGLSEPALSAASAYLRSAYAIAVDSGEALGKLFDGQIAELNKSAAVALDQLAKSAPAGSDVAVAAMKSAIAAANATYDNVAKATKTVVEMAEANVVSTGAVVKAAGKATKKAA